MTNRPRGDCACDSRHSPQIHLKPRAKNRHWDVLMTLGVTLPGRRAEDIGWVARQSGDRNCFTHWIRPICSACISHPTFRGDQRGRRSQRSVGNRSRGRDPLDRLHLRSEAIVGGSDASGAGISGQVSPINRSQLCGARQPWVVRKQRRSCEQRNELGRFQRRCSSEEVGD
jgi:hypothetical protein